MIVHPEAKPDISPQLTSCGFAGAAELAEMRNKIRLLQGEASAGLTGATAGALPEEASEDSPNGSQIGERGEEDQSASQRRKIRYLKFCASLHALASFCKCMSSMPMLD